uniref:Late embryogenesis abundant protein LEA-2 subgroup domain-containing protein n=1 Tax=Oryza meridionalis TaxID=40149 RepID=A0A0E0C8A7_9ORYZ
MGAGIAEDDDDHGDCLDRRPCLRYFLLATFLATLLSLMAYGQWNSMFRDHDLDAFSVRLAGYEGIDLGRPAATVSPKFRVTLGTANGACVDRAAVTVLYSGVALGWARAEPRDCAAGRLERDVEVVARGQGVGLSDRLRARMASEWRRSSGALELDVDVKIFDEDTYPVHATYHIPDRVMLCKVRTDGRGSESPSCAWFSPVTLAFA